MRHALAYADTPIIVVITPRHIIRHLRPLSLFTAFVIFFLFLHNRYLHYTTCHVRLFFAVLFYRLVYAGELPCLPFFLPVAIAACLTRSKALREGSIFADIHGSYRKYIIIYVAEIPCVVLHVGSRVYVAAHALQSPNHAHVFPLKHHMFFI